MFSTAFPRMVENNSHCTWATVLRNLQSDWTHCFCMYMLIFLYVSVPCIEMEDFSVTHFDHIVAFKVAYR